MTPFYVSSIIIWIKKKNSAIKALFDSRKASEDLWDSEM